MPSPLRKDLSRWLIATPLHRPEITSTTQRTSHHVVSKDVKAVVVAAEEVVLAADLAQVHQAMRVVAAPVDRASLPPAVATTAAVLQRLMVLEPSPPAA